MTGCAGLVCWLASFALILLDSFHLWRASRSMGPHDARLIKDDGSEFSHPRANFTSQLDLGNGAPLIESAFGYASRISSMFEHRICWRSTVIRRGPRRGGV
ncbi:hypothetical protein SAY86_020273 [Trapa natans]|uniref:Secreted protein n=1 Tax=Trapa natans TaxID=22666 RepID=A0AAN7LQA8_TRANT|nr:hypothetical protein SAY86_020273 [Trapa natans]